MMELPKPCHMSQLSYTEAVLHESMCLSSVSPTGLPHMTIRDIAIQGYDVPKNTMVIISTTGRYITIQISGRM